MTCPEDRRDVRFAKMRRCILGLPRPTWTTGLEPVTSAVTAKRKVVTYRKQALRIASFGAARNDREQLSNPYQTHDLCPVSLCPPVENRGGSNSGPRQRKCPFPFPDPHGSTKGH